MRRGIEIFIGISLLASLNATTKDLKGLSDPERDILPLTENFKKAEEIAKAYKIPLVVLFLGSSWSKESQNFITEFLENPKCISSLRKDFIFVRVDFPQLSVQARDLIAENHALKERFQIENFPTLVILDHNGYEINRLGYLSGNGEQYTSRLLDAFNTYQHLRYIFKEERKLDLSQEHLEQLYIKVKDLGYEKYIGKVLDYALQHDPSAYFLMEKYSLLINSDDVENAFADSLRKEILAKDSDNLLGLHHRLALLDFQRNSSKQNLTSKEVIAPLVNYIKTFGYTDQDNLWRMHLLISEYLYSVHNIQDALKYAKISHREAPHFRKLKIGALIDKFEAELEETKIED